MMGLVMGEYWWVYVYCFRDIWDSVRMRRAHASSAAWGIRTKLSS